MLRLFIVLYSFVVLASAKDCNPGQKCELRCCTIPQGNVLCRERCLGLSCELDIHCDGDCCVNTTCSSCLLKRHSATRSSVVRSSIPPTSTAILQTTDKPSVATEMMDSKAMNREDRFKVTRRISTNKPVETKFRHACSRFNNRCHSECCINGQCVDRSRCVPVNAARGGRSSGGGMGYKSDTKIPVWGWVLIGTVVLLCIVIPFCCYFTIKHCYKD